MGGTRHINAIPKHFVAANRGFLWADLDTHRSAYWPLQVIVYDLMR